MAWRCRTICLSAILSLSASLVSGEEIKKAGKTWDDYKIISERNIFDRSRVKFMPVTEVQAPAVIIPEQTYYILRGVTQQAETLISFIEDSRTMEVKKVKKGEKIGGGKVGNITLDYISYEYGGKAVKVEIGMNLEGQASASGGQYYSSRPNLFQGNAQTQEMGQPQGAGLSPQAGQLPGQAQAPGAGQSPVMGQGQSTTQPPPTGQGQPTAQPRAIDQSQTPAKAVTETGQGENSSDVLQRLKERRKKELE